MQSELTLCLQGTNWSVVSNSYCCFTCVYTCESDFNNYPAVDGGIVSEILEAIIVP